MSKKSEIEKVLEAEKVKKKRQKKPKAITIPTQVPTTDSPKSSSTTVPAPAKDEDKGPDPEAEMMVFIPSDQYEKALAAIAKQDKAIEKAAEMFDRLIDRFGALADSVDDVKKKADEAAARVDNLFDDLNVLEEQVDEIHDTLLDLCEDEEDEKETEEITQVYALKLPDGTFRILTEEEIEERGLKNPESKR